MKIKVTKKAYYNNIVLKEGTIIDIKEKNLPSWAEPLNKKDKTPEKTPEEQKTPEVPKEPEKNPEPEETPVPEVTLEIPSDVVTVPSDEEYLEALLNEAMDKNILLQDADKKTVKEQINELEQLLGKNGVAV